MRYQFFYKSFLLESRFKRAESRDLKTFMQKYVGIPNAMYSFRSKLVSTNYPSGINPSIGINPRNRYNTPTGIYGYPLEETFHKMMTDSLEFATDRPIVIVYKPKNNVPIVRTSTFSEKDLEEKLKILEKLFLLSSEQIQLEIDGLDSRYKKSPAQTLWSLVRALTNKNVNKWATTMISIGVPVFIDDNESGTIHSAEPTQCVVFGKNFVEIIGVYEKPIISSKLSSISKVGDIIIDSLWSSFGPTLLTFDEKRLFYADRKIMHILKYISEFENEDRFKLAISLLDHFNEFKAQNNVKEDSVTLLFEKYISIVIPKTFETSLDLKDVLNLFNRLYRRSNRDYIKRIIKIIINRLSESIKEINSLWNFLVVSSFDFNYINDVDFQDSLFSLLSENSEKIQEKLIDFSNLLQKHILEISKEKNADPSFIDMKAGNISNFLNFCMSNFKDASFIMTDFVLLAARIFEKYLSVSYYLHDINKTQLYKSLYEILEYIKYKNPKMYKELQTEKIVLNFQEQVVEKVISRIGELEDQTTKLLVDLFAKNGPIEYLSELYVSVRIALNDKSYTGRDEIYEEILDILEERLENKISSGKVYEETWYNVFKNGGYGSIEKRFFERLDLFLAKILDEDKLREVFSIEKLIDFLTNDASKVILSSGNYEGDVDLKKDKELFLQFNDGLQPDTLHVHLSSFWHSYMPSNVLPKLIRIYSEKIKSADLGDIKI